MQEFDEESVAEFDGRQGRPTYVVVDGRIYDVSASPRWRNGEHMRRHQAGSDLTADLGAAPHGPEKLEKFPQVGVLAPATDATAGSQGLPVWVVKSLERFPSLQRHPHPMTVHFPIACAFGALSFSVVKALTGVESFGTTALHCLAAGVLVTPVAILTGFIAWKINYLARPMRPVRWKIGLSLLLWVVFGVGAVLSRGEALGAATSLLAGVVSATLASVLGAIGASLTFPVKRG